MKMSPGRRPRRNGSRSRPANVSRMPKPARASPSAISMRPTEAIPSVWRRAIALGERAPAMQPEQDLHQPVRDQLMQRQQLLIGAHDRIDIARVGHAAAGLEGVGGFLDDRVGDHLARHLPQRDEAVDGGREADLEYAELAG